VHFDVEVLDLVREGGDCPLQPFALVRVPGEEDNGGVQFLPKRDKIELLE
jgi:hypothetical protein